MELNPSFNGWYEDWIEVERLNGTTTEVSLATLLQKPMAYRTIYDASPLSAKSIERLLCAIVQDVLHIPNTPALEKLWQSEWPVAKFQQFGNEFGNCFEIFAKDKPFLQA